MGIDENPHFLSANNLDVATKAPRPQEKSQAKFQAKVL
jgi:hypothetical protein